MELKIRACQLAGKIMREQHVSRSQAFLQAWNCVKNSLKN